MFSESSGIGRQLNVLNYEKAILVNVLSQTFRLPGVRIGRVITRNEELSKLIRYLKTYNSICQSQLDEQVACFVMQKADALIKRNNEIVRENIELFDAFVANNDSLSWHRPEAGMLGLVHSSEPLKPLLDSWFEKGVLVLPGELFNIEGNYFRVGFGKKEFSQALACIAAD